MNETIYELRHGQVVRRGDRYFVRYDAGSQANAWREDEITEAEFQQVMDSPRTLYDVVIGIQRRLGLDANTSNWTPPNA